MVQLSRKPNRTGRPIAIRHAHASNASTGSTDAAPKPCSSKSATPAPIAPSKLLAGWEVAVLSDGSCGL